MKHLLYFIAALLLLGCQQTTIEEQYVAPNNTPRFYGSFNDENTRTFLNDEVELCWHAEDHISIFANTAQNMEYKFDGDNGDKNGYFTAISKPSMDQGDNTGYNYAVYPYDSTITLNNDGSLSVNYPSQQTYAEGSFARGANVMVAVTESATDYDLTFRNVCSYLKVCLWGESQRVKSITVTSNGDEALSGDASIIARYNNTPECRMTEEGNSVTLDCGDGIDISSSSITPTEFWITLPPVTLAQGFTVEVANVDGATKTFEVAKTFTFKRNTYYSLTRELSISDSSITNRPPNNELWLTTKFNSICKPTLNDWGINLISATYKDDKCIIVFDGPITTLGDYCFQFNDRIESIIMPDCVESIGVSAFFGCQNLSNICLSKNLVSIGSGAFEGCFGLTEIELYDNLKTISDWAFSMCSSLTDITIPNSIESIEDYAFNFCSGLVNLTLGSGLKTIGQRAFENCTQLSGSITFGDNLEYIGEGAFYQCSNLSGITFGENLQYIGKEAFYGCSNIRDITIPNSVTFIGADAFKKCPITNLKLGSGITEIPENAFSGYSSIENITFDDSLVSIGAKAFYYGKYTSITLPAGVTYIGDSALYTNTLQTVYCKATTPPTLGNNAFWHNITIYVPAESVNDYRTAAGWSRYAPNIEGYDFDTNTDIPTPPSNNQIFYTSISNSVISPRQTHLKVVSNTMVNGKGVIEFDGEITSIMHHSFYEKDLLTSITLPSSVTTIENDAFLYCSNLQSVKGIDNVISIGEDAFSSCPNLSDITLGDKLTSIDSYAFSGCSNLKSITIPNSLTNMGYQVFTGCTNLEEFKGKGATNDGKGLILDGTLYALISNGSECVIPNGVTNIANGVFYSNNNIHSVTIPEGVTNIGESVFNSCENLEKVEFPHSLNSIGKFAFYNCTNLKSIKLHPNTHTIDANAFGYCSNLSDINLPSGLININYSAFYECDALTTITLPYTLRTIGHSAFANCSNLSSVYCKSVTVPEPILFNGGMWDAFKDNAPGRIIYVPSGKLNDYCNMDGWTPYRFEMAEYIVDYEEIDPDTMPDDRKIYYTSTNGSIVKPVNSDIYGASILVNRYENGTGIIIFDGSITTICDSAFKNSTTLKSITIPNSVTSIESEAFSHCSNLEEINFGTGVTSIGNNAFDSCTSLNSLFIPANINYIGEDAFKYCSALKKIDIESLKSWCGIAFVGQDTNPLAGGGGLYLNNELITDLVITSDITKINGNAFYNYLHLTSVTIGNSVKTIGKGAFRYCDNLLSVNILDGVTTIDDDAFYYCENLKDVALGSDVEIIGDQAFCGCKCITSIVIPDSVTTIESQAFYGCSALASVSFGRGIKSIGRNAFCRCNSLKAFEGWLASDDGMCLIIDGRLVAFICNCPISPYTFPENITVIGNASVFDCESVTEFIIPDSVTTIESSAFEYCFNLKTLTIGANVETIGYWAFGNCFALKSVYCRAVTPPKPTYFADEWNVFDSYNITRKIYVPMESVEAYKTAEGWSEFADQIIGYNFKEEEM